MRRILTCVVLAGVAVGAFVAATWLYHSRQPRERPEDILAAYRERGGEEALKILYPLDEAVFPPEIAPPTFRWQEGRADADAWLVSFEFQDQEPAMHYISRATQWTPADEHWERMKRRSCEKPARVTILGYKRTDPGRILSAGRVSISTSRDEVGAPLFFREVNLPFLTAVKDPAAHIRWRFGEISSKGPPPIVLEKLPVCGNCHSFSRDGSTLAMEVDSGNDKGSYAIAPITPEITLDPGKIITWTDYRREDNEKTFGLLCQVSPDGRYVAGTVKDRALAVYRPDLAFSQLFFLVKGIVAIYDRQTGSFSALPGADDREYVQTNATWSPDGKTIVFARSRSKAYDPPSLRKIDSILVPPQEADEFVKGGRTFLFDLYRIPFNDGKGGRPEPIEGASNNGMSNYFAKFSPDGKWIVFCKAKSFMLLQPDSELYIIPAAGGEARRLRCNMQRMNSWHSWSPNSRWLVFSSKAYSDFTQLFLTHIDEHGESTPPVVLANFTEPERAANIPEFVNVRPGAIAKIHEQFLDDSNYYRAATEFHKQGDLQNAMRLYRRALELNENNAVVHNNLGSCFLEQGNLSEAESHLRRAIELRPDLASAYGNLGNVRLRQDRVSEAIAAYRQALRLDPTLAEIQTQLGTLLLRRGESKEAVTHLSEAARLSPRDPSARFNLGMALLADGQPDQASVHFEQALAQDPDYVPAMVNLAIIRATSADSSRRNGPQAVRLAEKAGRLTQQGSPEVLYALAAAYAEVGRFPEAVAAGELALRIISLAGNEKLATPARQALQCYRQGKPFRSRNH